jgi:hypothetical protein
MASFVTVTRRETQTPQVVNLDTVEMIDIVPPDGPPPLDSPLPLTAAHVGSSILHFASGRMSMHILESGEELQALIKTDDPDAASKKTVESHKKKLAELMAKRLKERQDAEKAKIEAKREAEDQELKAMSGAE